MTNEEFASFVRHHNIDMYVLADIAGYTYRTVKSFYYGERKVPPRVADAARVLALGTPRRRPAADTLGSVLRDALALASSKLTTERDTLRAAVDKMCRECEPSGFCRTARCPLREVSALPLISQKAYERVA